MEMALRQEGIGASVISTPGSVAVGCGLSVRFDGEDLPKVRRIIRQTHYETLIGLYLVDTTSGRARLQSYTGE